MTLVLRHGTVLFFHTRSMDIFCIVFFVNFNGTFTTVSLEFIFEVHINCIPNMFPAISQMYEMHSFPVSVGQM